MDYRRRIYEKYASVCKGCSSVFNEREAIKYCAAFSHYLSEWLPSQKDASILDLACGNGKTLFLRREKGYSAVSGFDISAEQVALARQVNDNVTQAEGFRFLQQCKRKYDLILALDIIEHLTKQEVFDMLVACFSAPNSRGRLILSSPNAASPMFGSRRYGDFTHEVCFTPESLAHILNVVGFEKVSSREIAPYCHGIVSGLRTLLWVILRELLILYNLIEIGHARACIYTRDFLITSVKPDSLGLEL